MILNIRKDIYDELILSLKRKEPINVPENLYNFAEKFTIDIKNIPIVKDDSIKPPVIAKYKDIEGHIHIMIESPYL